MEIKAKRESLLATLYWTQSIVERRNTMPILANVLFECSKGSIRVTATDLEVGVRGEVEGDVSKEGTVTINAKKISIDQAHEQVDLVLRNKGHVFLEAQGNSAVRSTVQKFFQLRESLAGKDHAFAQPEGPYSLLFERETMSVRRNHPDLAAFTLLDKNTI